MFHLPRLVFPWIARQPLLVSLKVKGFKDPVLCEEEKMQTCLGAIKMKGLVIFFFN